MRLWKKVLAAATAGMLCLGSVGASGVQSVLESVGTVLSVSAIVPKIYNNTYDNLYYSVTDADEIAIVGCNTDVVSVEVPKEIDGKSVTKIGNSAFSRCASLTQIIIPDSVSCIEKYAFDSCTSLTNITIPSGVTNIGERAFYGCTSLTNITIPSSVIDIGDRAFSGTPWLTTKQTKNPLVVIIF